METTDRTVSLFRTNKVNYYLSEDGGETAIFMAQTWKSGIDNYTLVWKAYIGIETISDWYDRCLRKGTMIMDDSGNWINFEIFQRLTEHMPTQLIAYDLEE